MQLTHRRDHPSCGGKGGSSCQKLVTSELSHLFLSQAAEVRLMDSPSGPCVDPTILVAPPRGCHVQEGSLNDFDFSPPLLVSEIPHCYRRLNNSTLSCFPFFPPFNPTNLLYYRQVLSTRVPFTTHRTPLNASRYRSFWFTTLLISYRRPPICLLFRRSILFPLPAPQSALSWGEIGLVPCLYVQY